MVDNRKTITLKQNQIVKTNRKRGDGREHDERRYELRNSILARDCEGNGKKNWKLLRILQRMGSVL